MDNKYAALMLGCLGFLIFMAFGLSAPTTELIAFVARFFPGVDYETAASRVLVGCLALVAIIAFLVYRIVRDQETPNN